MLVLSRGRSGSGPARVLEQVRRAGTATREELSRRTGLSAATVARAVATLVEECFVRERPDLVPDGLIGRPSVPLEVRPDRHVVLGVHLGKRTTTVALVDLAGQLVSQTRSATPSTGPADLVAGVLQRATALLSESPQRFVLCAGLVAPWGDIGLDQDDLTRRLVAATGLRVATAHHVAAVIAAEYLTRRQGANGCTAYLYARDTAGFALATDHSDRTEISRVSALAHFPTRSDVVCACGATGCLEAVASNHALARRAYDDGLVDRPEIDALHAAAAAGSSRVHERLCERARVLGRSAAVLSDMVAPDRMVLVGQAFTGYPPALDEVVAAFGSATVLPPIEVSFTRFGTGVQAVAAGTVALGPVFEDPLRSVGRVTRLDRSLESLPC